MSFCNLEWSPIARFMGPTWGPSGADRTQVGPMLAPWTLLSGVFWLTHSLPSGHRDDAMITSLSHQDDVTTLFWRNNDAIIASCVRWEVSSPIQLRGVAFEGAISLVAGPRGGTRSGFIRGCAAPGSEPLPYIGIKPVTICHSHRDDRGQ